MEVGQTFDLGRIYGAAEGVKGVRMENQLRQQQLDTQQVMTSTAKAAVDPTTGQYSAEKHAQALTAAGYPQVGQQLLAQQIETGTKFLNYVGTRAAMVNAENYPAFKAEMERSGLVPANILPAEYGDGSALYRLSQAMQGKVQEAYSAYQALYTDPKTGQVVVGQRNLATGEAKNPTVLKPQKASRPIAVPNGDGTVTYRDPESVAGQTFRSNTGAGANEPLVAVIGDNGQPVLMRRSQAEGRRPAPTGAAASGGMKIPSGYRIDPNNPDQVVPIPGGPAEKMAGDMAGKASLLDEAQRAVQDASSLLFDQNGQLNLGTVVNATGNTPFTEGRQARQRIRVAVEAALRITSGAAVPDTEVDRYTDLFTPSPLDGQATAAQKFQSLVNFVDGAKANMMTGRGQAAGAPTAPPRTPPAMIPGQGQPQPQGAPQGPTATATGPNGQRLGLINGQWVPLQ